MKKFWAIIYYRKFTHYPEILCGLDVGDTIFIEAALMYNVK